MSVIPYGNELQKRLLGEFKGTMSPTPVPWSYRVGLVVVAIVMVILPVIYVALIGLLLWATYWYAVDFGPSLFTAGGTGFRAGRARLFAYVAPLLVAVILTLFLVKPLFASPSEDDDEHLLNPAQEPLLFAFVRKLCETVGAPMPSMIAIDNEVNASASPRKGLLSLLQRDLRLTIGLPLVAGLNANQFAGVLAHEFGHFAQVSGMTVTYVIRSVNRWFYRVAYERDRVDEWLEDQLQSTEGWLWMVLTMAKGGVWVSRGLLRLLMMVGAAVSCYMLRQMEFDADRYEAKLVGGTTFAETARELLKLSYSSQLAFQDQQNYFSAGQLCSNHAALVKFHRQKQHAKLEQAAQEHLNQSRTGFFDTHPCDLERIQNAHRFGQSRVFQSDLPAQALFRDFSKLSEQQTNRHLSQLLNRSLEPNVFKSIDELKRLEADQERRFAALHRVFRLVYLPGRWPALEPNRPAALKDLVAIKAELIRIRERVGQQDAAHQACIGRWRKQTEERDALIRYREASRSVVCQPQWFDLEPALDDVDAAIDRSRAEVLHREKELAVYEQSVLEAANLSLWLANNRQFQEKVGLNLSPVWQDHVNAVHAAVPLIETCRDQCVEMSGLLIAWGHTQNERLHSPVAITNKGLVSNAADLVRQFDGKPLPFEHADPEMDVASYISQGTFDLEDPILTLRSVYMTLNALNDVSQRAMASLAEVIEQVESRLGLAPNPDIDAQVVEKLSG